MTSDVVLVESSGSVLFPGEREERVSPNGLMTLVVKRQGDEWRIVSFQNTPTGRRRNAHFLWRFLVSRLSVLRAEMRKARAHMMEDKERNLSRWNSHQA